MNLEKFEFKKYTFYPHYYRRWSIPTTLLIDTIMFISLFLSRPCVIHELTTIMKILRGWRRFSDILETNPEMVVYFVKIKIWTEGVS